MLDKPIKDCKYFAAAARLIQDNFQTMQSATPFQAGNRIDVNQQINLGCQVEGSPRPLVFWKLSKSNGQVVDAACSQGFDCQYQQVPLDQRAQPALANNLVVSMMHNYCWDTNYVLTEL